jgi:hypothetical protein
MRIHEDIHTRGLCAVRPTGCVDRRHVKVCGLNRDCDLSGQSYFVVRSI